MQRPTAFLLGAPIGFSDEVEATIFGLELSEDPWTLVSVLAKVGFPGGDRRRLPATSEMRVAGGKIVAAAAFGPLEHVAAQAEHGGAKAARFDAGTRIQFSAPERPAAEPFVRFAGVVADPDSRVVRSFVGNESRWLSRLVRVPVQPSTWQSPEWIWVRLQPGMLGHLPPFMEDGDVRERVVEALAARMGAASVESLLVEVVDGSVSVRGNVRSERERLVAERTAAGVGGAREVKAGVVTDPDLEVAVAAALAQAGLSRRRPLLVHSRLGRVRLAGDAPAADVQAAREAAMAVAGVREVLGPGEVTTSEPSGVAPDDTAGALVDDRPGSQPVAG